MAAKTKTTDDTVGALISELKKHGGEAGTKELFAALKEQIGWTFPREMRVHLLANDGKKFLRTGTRSWALASHASPTRRSSSKKGKRSKK